MGKINVLDFQVANLIAAGEVVERPASAVKELLENAIDAGAGSVTVEIKRGGTTFIRVTDDGCGMSAEDLPVSIMRHATSKIRDAADLDGITTLGFRGEALAAIASVSHMRIMSRTKRAETGNVLESVAGEAVDLSEAGMPRGTTVIVEDLFANVPARRKFLKRDASEATACAAVVEKIALAKPKVAVKFISDGTIKFATSGDGDLKSAIYAVLGRDFAAKMTEVRDLSDGIGVYGYIGRPDNNRGNRNFENFFINGRYVKSRTAMSALEQAYESFIPSDKFPCCVLNVDIHPTFVDVNVHPTKLEVKFSNERLVFEAIYSAVRNALNSKLDRPEMVVKTNSVSAEDIALANAFMPIFDHASEPPHTRYSQAGFFDTASPPAQNTPVAPPEAPPVAPAPADAALAPDYMKIDLSNVTRESPEYNNYDLPPVAPPEPPAPAASGPSVSDEVGLNEHVEYRIIGEAFNSYVIVEVENKVLMIDKHAAHERINFERMKRNVRRSEGGSQMMLVPVRISLDPRGYSALRENADELKTIGFLLEFSDADHSAALTGYPSKLDEEDACDLLDELCDRLSEGTGTVRTSFESLLEKALYQASCKASIKAGHVEDAAHVKWICDNLLALPDIKFCPHGRPVAIELTRSEIEKQFKRT